MGESSVELDRVIIRFHDGRGKPHVVHVNRLTQCFGLLSSGSKFKALTCMMHNAKLLRSRKVLHKSPGCHMVLRVVDGETSNTTARSSC